MFAWDEMRREGWVTNGDKETFRDNGYVHYMDYNDRFMVVYCMPMSKLIKLYILKVCSSMYINYTAIKLLKRKRGTNKPFCTFYS